MSVASSIGIVSPADNARPHVALVPPPPAERFPGLSHREALALELPTRQDILKGAVERGSPGTVAGLPESWKSWLALELAMKVAAEKSAQVLGLDVETHGPAGFWWQDDSTQNELERLKLYAARHGYTADLALRYHLNEGMRLPDDVDYLREEAEREGQVLQVLDSLYNFLPPHIKLKDEEVAQVIDLVKREVCDRTGCAVAFVDHSAWPSEGNKGQRRAYGSVFKAAGIRWGIYLAKKNEDEVWIEASGNNVRGLRKQLFVWDAEALEFRPARQEADQELELCVREYIRDHPGCSQNEVEKNVAGKAERIREVYKSLWGDEE